MEKEITVALISGFAAAFITAIFSFIANNRNNISVNIIQERTKWRDNIRKLSQSICECKENKGIELLKQELQLMLNPSDIEDQEIIKLLMKKGNNDTIINNSIITDELNTRLALLLKHDWERAKLENTIIKKYFIIAKRVSYKEYKENSINIKWTKCKMSTWFNTKKRLTNASTL